VTADRKNRPADKKFYTTDRKYGMADSIFHDCPIHTRITTALKRLSELPPESRSAVR